MNDWVNHPTHFVKGREYITTCFDCEFLSVEVHNHSLLFCAKKQCEINELNCTGYLCEDRINKYVFKAVEIYPYESNKHKQV